MSGKGLLEGEGAVVVGADVDVGEVDLVLGEAAARVGAEDC